MFIFVSLLCLSLPPSQAGEVKALCPLPMEARLDAAAVALESALGTGRVRALENPVLPRAKAAEDLRLHGFRAGETQVGLHGAQRIRREAGARLDHHPQFVVPVEILDRGGDEAERLGRFRLERRADLLLGAIKAVRLAA